MKKSLFLLITSFITINIIAQNISGVINMYAGVTDVNECTNSLDVDVASPFSVNDQVLIIQMKGADINVSNSSAFGSLLAINNTGRHELNTITSISGNTITFLNTFQYPYDANGKVQIVSFPNFTANVTVTATLQAMPWDGFRGGVVAFNTTGDLILNADIDVSGQGFRGGTNIALPSGSYNCNALSNVNDYFFPNGTEFASGKGEGIADYITNMGSGRGRQLNGGGGGNDHNAGGGGGAGSNFGGIGGINNEPSLFGCDGDFPGIGGSGLNMPNRFIFSGGGGAGHGNNTAGINIGGNAGGLVFIEMNQINANGYSIKADGQNGNNGINVDNDGAPGAGAGGLIYINSVSNNGTGVLLSAIGGNGGNVDDGNANRCHGPGGGGGGGLIQTSLTSNLSNIINGGSPGIVLNSTNACNGTSVGATAGQLGTVNNVAYAQISQGTPFAASPSIIGTNPFDTIIVCEGSNPSITVNTSTSPISYQWQIKTAGVWTDLTNIAPYSGVNTSTLQMISVTSAMSTNLYRTLLYDACDSLYLDSTVLIVNLNGIITSHPQNQVVCIGDNANFSASGNNILSYQWQSNEMGIFLDLTNNATYSNVSTNSLNITNVTNTLNGVMYRLVMVDDCGNTINTNTAILSLTSLTSIVNESSSFSTCEFSDSYFYITAGNSLDSILWQVDSGAGFVDVSPFNNNDTLFLLNNALSLDGNIYRAIEINACLNDTSSNMTLTVATTSMQTNNNTICNGDSLFVANAWQTNAGTYYDTIPGSAGTFAINQLFYSEDFNTSPLSWILNTYTGPIPSTDGNFYNLWINDAIESGQTLGTCSNAAATLDKTLYVGNQLSSVYPGATYLEGGSFRTNRAAETPNISTIGKANISLDFDFIGQGDGLLDNTTLLYSLNGAAGPWVLLDPSLKSAICGASAATWEHKNYMLPIACENIANLRIRFNWENDDVLGATDPSFALNNFTLTEIIPAIPTVCDNIIETILSISPILFTSINDTICNNETYTLPSGSIVNSTGTYIDTLSAVSTCDSIITTNLVVNPTFALTINASICDNETYALPSGTIVSTAGTYLDTLSATNTCDSVVTTILVVNPTFALTVNASICDNETYTLPSGTVVNTTGIYLDTLSASNTCDSVITTNLSVLPTATSTLNETICDNQTYTLPSGAVISIAGTYLDTIPAVNTCDSVITINLFVLPTFTSTTNVTICSNQSYTLPSGIVVNTAGTFLDTLSAVNTCDSVITTNLTILQTASSTTNATICDNETYTLPSGTIVNTAGTYLDTLSASNTCDSVVTTILVVNPTVATTINASICDDETYLLPSGTVVNTAGTYLDTLSTSNTCDSVITTNLTVLPTASSTFNDTICDNQTYTLPSGIVVNIAGAYIDTIPALNTCDSVMTINLFVTSTLSSITNATICSNQIYTLPSGTIVTAAGTYMDTLTATTACDSVVTTNLTVLPTATSTINATICDNETYTLPNGTIVNTSGTYLDTLTAINTCDSVVTTILVVNPTFATIINASICDNETFLLPSGTVVNTAGTYLDTLSAITTCDSIVTTNLIVLATSTSTINTTICSNETYVLPSGITVNTAGTYLDTIAATNTCDSVITVNLTVIPTSTFAFSDTICSGLNYTLPSGTIVTSTGVYLDTIPAVNTCDSVIIITLTVIPTISISTMPADLTICEDSSALFYISANGQNLTFQWQINTGTGFNNIPSFTNDTLTIANVSNPLDLNGAEVRVVMNSYCGNIIVSNSALITIDYNVALISNPNNAIVCEDEDTVFSTTTNGSETNVSWQMNNGSGFIDVPNSLNYSGLNTLNLQVKNIPYAFNGNTYRAIVNDNCGFTDTTTFAMLTVNPLPQITLQPTAQNECLGNNIQFNINANFTTNYQWQVNTGTGFNDLIGETGIVLNLTGITQAMNGNIYQCVTSNSCGTIISDAVILTVNEIGNILSEPSDMVICPDNPGFNFDFTVSVNNINIFQWQIDTGTGFINIPSSFNNLSGETTNSLEITVPYENIDDAIFRMLYTDDCGNSGISNEYNVRISSPNSIIGIDDVIMCQREIETVEVDYNGINYQWNDVNNTVGRFLDPTESGEYIVTYFQNSSSCMASDTINIELKDCLAECVITAPTGFSPTGSLGKNDVFRAIYGCDLDYFELMVVNRWGEIVFVTNSPDEYWDGTYKGEQAPSETYAWYINYNKKGLNDRQSTSGNVTLIK